MKTKKIEIEVRRADVADVEADVLLLKYARILHGADEMVAFRLAKAGIRTEDQIKPDVDEALFVESAGAIKAKQILFLGTLGLRRFRYKQMRSFACKALKAIGEQVPEARYGHHGARCRIRTGHRGSPARPAVWISARHQSRLRGLAGKDHGGRAGRSPL